jgi:hypothetical protein
VCGRVGIVSRHEECGLPHAMRVVGWQIVHDDDVAGVDLPPIFWTPDQAAWRSACSGVIYPRAQWIR